MTHKILIVEDNPVNMELAADLLELARSEMPDAIVMEMGLP